MAENAGSPEHLEELYRQAMLQQEEYSAQRRGGQEVSPAVQRPETQSPNHDELLLLDEVEQDGPTDERLPPEAWSSPQPWRCADQPLLLPDLFAPSVWPQSAHCRHAAEKLTHRVLMSASQRACFEVSCHESAAK